MSAHILNRVTANGEPLTLNEDGSTTIQTQGDIDVVAEYVAEAPPSFVETCDAFDASKWRYEYNPPVAQNGEWVFDWPVGVQKGIHARSIALFGYGHYKITFRTSGPRVPGVNYYLFLFNDQTSSGGPYNELDIPELYGAHTPTTMSISTFKGSITNSAYRYWQSAINFEDGLTHTWEFDYLPTTLRFYIDGQLSFAWEDDPIAPKFANPPMYLIIGGNSNGTNTAPWTWYIGEIQYTFAIPPSHALSITSNLTGFSITINGVNKTIPYSEELTEGIYAMMASSNIIIGSDIYNFSQWEDGSTNPQRVISLMTDMALIISYVLVQPPITKGRIKVHAFLDSTEIVVNGTIVETGQAFQTPTIIDIDPGTYVVRVTLGNQTKEQFAVVTENQTIRLDFQFKSITPISPFPVLQVLTPIFIGGAAIGISKRRG